MLDLIPVQYRFAAQVAFIVAIGFALFAGYYRMISYHEQIGFDRATASCTAEKLIAEQAANQREADYQTQLRKANHDAETRQAALSADVARLNSQLVRMRHDRDAMRTRVAELSSEAARRVASAGIDLLNECSEQYSRLAEAADQCISDRQTLIDSWPK